MVNQIVAYTLNLPIDVYVVDPIPSSTNLSVVVNIVEPILAIEPLEIQVGSSIELTPIQYNLTQTLKLLAEALVRDKITTAFDTDIEMKMLLNFGDDIQQLLVAKEFYQSKPTHVKLKLLDPLIPQFDINSELWISREVASSVLDRVNLLPAPLIDTTPYLRPRNTNIRFANLSGKNLRNITWDKLNLNITGNLTGSAPTALWNYKDDVMRRWYTDDWKSSELNIDFSDYANFVMYGSAEKRLAVFVEKLKQIEHYQSQSYSADISASLQTSQKYSLEIENIIRSFDPYETHLYFETGVPYSASTTWAGTEYNVDGTWPKSGGVPVSPYSVTGIDWYTSQSAIAERFDGANQNYLTSNLPGHILDNDENIEFWDFIDMIGHYFDNIKPYVDAAKYIYSRTPNVDRELSEDLIWQVAYSFGTELPNKSALDTLSRYLFGENSSLAGRAFTSEIWKRILHSYVFLTKMKGTRSAVRSIFHSFGISAHQLPIRETARPVTSSVFYSDESTYALNFNDGAYIIVPWTASVRDNYAIEFRFSTTDNNLTTLLNAEDSWKLQLVPHPTIETYSRLEVQDGASTTLLSSSYDTFTDGTFYNVVLQKDLSGTPKIELDVRQTDGTRVLVSSYNSISTGSFTTFDTPTNIYLGGSGSISTNTFSGMVDEFRIWGITLDEETKEEHAYNAGSHTGNEISDAYNYLYVMLSFNKPENVAGSFGLVTNETPYFNVDGISKPFDILRTNLSVFQTYGFANVATYPYQTNIITRVSRYRGIVGGSLSYVSNKVRIAEPPVTGSDYTLLSHKMSIVPITDKRDETVGSNVVGIFMSPTDVINQMVYRAFGYFDLDDYIGYPGDKFKNKYTSLYTIQNIFANQYFKGYNPGEFIRFFDSFTNSIFEYLIEFIPAKAVLARGIIIEPSVLERSKQTINQPLRIDGTGTRNSNAGTHDSIYGLEAETIDTKTDIGLTGDLTNFFGEIGVELQSAFSEYSTFEGRVTESSRTEIDLEYSLYEADITAFDQSDVPAEFTYYEGLTAIDNETTILPEYVTFETSQSLDLSVDGEYEYSNFDWYVPLNVNYTQSAVMPYELAGSYPFVYEIGPNTDLNDIGVTTYFNQKEGIYNRISYIKRPITASYMTIPPTTIPEWTPGEFYTKGDIVQQVGLYEQEFWSGSAVQGSALSGNGKYFVFTTDQQISGSTIIKFQSFNPPQYDTRNWQPIQYITKAYNTRKRVIYVDPTQEELLTGRVQLTCVELDRIATDTGLRKIYKTDNIELLGSSSTTGVIKLEKAFIILTLFSTEDNYRLRLYGNEESRNVDSGRAFGVDPDESVNVILDIIFESGTQNVEIRMNPPVSGMIDNAVLPNFVYYTLDNLDSTAKNLEITFNLFILEGVLKVPKEYLARHYRFFRDNSTGTKRRNFIGCLQTQETTTDNKPPVEIFSSEGNTLTVQPGSNTIGGNEFLNVT